VIRNILDLLPYAKGETENIKIAKGRYKMPETFKEGYKQLRDELHTFKNK
jgi:hypothetical protein|tara:strand:+ start:6024 stop:6173 length:150 start_codon:yes stop_codon:yes gene_type:complete